MDESRYKTNLFLSPNLVSIYEESGVVKGYLKNKLKLINRRILFHSSDSLPVLTTEENFFTDTTVTKRRSFLTKIEKFEFRRLAKPYDTNCRMYGNSTRFQCLNECYFDGYMNSDIKCIPNSESLFTIVLNSYSTESELKFCPLSEPSLIKKINSDLNKRCNKRCLEACQDIYYITEYDESLGSYLGDFLIRLHFKSVFFKRFKYFAKMTFLSLILNIANAFSLWHGITIVGLLDSILSKVNAKFPIFSVIKLIICKRSVEIRFKVI